MTLPTKGGIQEVLCPQLDYVPLWLAKISITPKMKESNPVLVDRLVEYQLRSKDVLADAFLDNKSVVPKDFAAALRFAADEYERRQLLEQKNEVLEKENDLLTQKALEWADRPLINALVRAYGYSLGGDFSSAWREFKKEILYRHSINLNVRITNYLNNSRKKTRPKTLDMLADDELPEVLSTAVALCRDRDVDISDIIEKKSS